MIKNDRIIKVLVDENPKKPKSRAFTKFSLLMKYNNKPVANFKDEEGKHPVLDKRRGWPAREIRRGIRGKLIKLAAA